MIPDRVAERAATKYVVEGECWISTYSTGSHGYAQVGWWEGGKGHGTTAHHAAYQFHYGATDETVDHTCHNVVCVNPAHLRPLSNAENGRRNSVANDYPLGWTCKRNHGVARNKNGNCPECVKIAQTRYNREVRRAL